MTSSDTGAFSPQSLPVKRNIQRIHFQHVDGPSQKEKAIEMILALRAALEWERGESGRGSSEFRSLLM
jgi:hypothetical protein